MHLGLMCIEMTTFSARIGGEMRRGFQALRSRTTYWCVQAYPRVEAGIETQMRQRIRFVLDGPEIGCDWNASKRHEHIERCWVMLRSCACKPQRFKQYNGIVTKKLRLRSRRESGE